MKRFGTLCFLMTVFPVLFLTSCDSLQKNKLTREKAKEIIIKECFGQNNKIPALGVFITGKHVLIWDNDLSYVNKLAKLGLLNLQHIPSSEKVFYNLDLTDATKPFVLNIEKDSDMGRERIVALIRLGDLSFNDVTGIRFNQDNKVALVDFNYKFTNLTPFGDNWYEGPTIGNLMKRSDLTITKFLKITADKDLEAKFDYKKKEPALQQAIVKMELFDDGWRVAKRKNNQE